MAVVIACWGPVSLCAQEPIRGEVSESLASGESELFGPPPSFGAVRDDVVLPDSGAARDFAKLMRPIFDVAAEWQPESGDVELATYDARVSMPTYPIFGPPPPFINFGVSYFDLNAPAELDLPGELYEYSAGMGWMRRINDRWMTRLMLSAAFASDHENNSSDAWQLRGGLFALYRPNEQWTWILGALALGRNDIPAVPAVGVIWQPNPGLRFDLTFPKPKAALLLVEQDARQQWIYVGGGFDGGTWGYQTSGGIDDQLTYRDWRFVAGWESVPTPEFGLPFTRGRKLGFEVGYVFGREFEFESDRGDISLDNSLLLNMSASF